MRITNAAELREAKQQRKVLADKLATSNKPDMTQEEARAWDATRAEFDAIDADIVAFESFQERQQAVSEFEKSEKSERSNRMKLPAEPRGKEQLRLFGNLGEQLCAIRNVALMGGSDERLNQLNAEARALGSSEGVGADGGFAVQTDFAGIMMETAIQEDDILSRVDTYDVSNNANGVKFVDIDETDISDTVFGGVQVYWTAEAKTVAASKPSTREVKLDLETLMGFAYATEQLLQDTTFMSQLYNRAFTVAIRRKLVGDVISGNGVGKPLGYLNSGALVTIPKETNQDADSVVYQNIVHMWGRMLPSSRRNAVWVMHPDVEEILPFMEFPVGTGGVPVFLPPSGVSGSPYSTLYGRPIIPDDNASALGDIGDISLVDFSEYMLIRKGGVQAASSIHVAFLTAENCFRFMFRANGKTKKESALKIKNSANLRSAFVTLAARA